MANAPETQNEAPLDAKSESPNTLLYKWTLKAVKDLNLVSGPAAETMCCRFNALIREFVDTLQKEESRKKIQSFIPRSITRVAKKIAPRLISAFKKQSEENKKEGCTKQTGAQRLKRKKHKNDPSKLINKSIKKVISAVKSIRQSEWDALAKNACAETKFGTVASVMNEYQDILSEAKVTSADIKKKIRAKLIDQLSGKGSSSSVVSVLTSAISDSASNTSSLGGVGKLFGLAQTFLVGIGTDGPAKPVATPKKTSTEPQGIIATLLRGFVRSQQKS